MNAAQIRFIDQIKQHLQRNGLLAPAALFRDPYTHYGGGLSGVFDQGQSAKIVRLLRGVEAGAMVG